MIKTELSYNELELIKLYRLCSEREKEVLTDLAQAFINRELEHKEARGGITHSSSGKRG